jgi:CPA2 family monovalent cation:H+ antiporter-2
MPHDTSLITTIVAALVLAFIFGAIANRLKMPPIVGYLIAGVCVGPYSPGFVANPGLASQLADLGVVLLMFGVGLHFSLKDLLSVKGIVIPGALIRMVFATAMGMGLGLLLHWPIAGALVFGLALAVSSTVVTLKVLQDKHLVDSDRGRVAIGWLVVEDLAMVLALVLIPAFAAAMSGDANGAATLKDDAFVALTEQLLHVHLVLWQVLLLTVIKLLAFAGFMIIVGRRIIPAILHATAHTGSRELFRLAVLAIALGVAAGASYLFGVSLALGAFFAGMILSESQLSQRAAQETLPLRDAFGVLFFVSVGMLFDPMIVVRQPLAVIATLAIIIFGKSIVGFLLMLLFRRPVASALAVSASLAQIGEFSFVLAALGVGLGILPEEGRGLILAGSIISIVLNPLVFWASERIRPRIEARVPKRLEPELGPIVPDHADQLAQAAAESGEVLEEQLQTTSLTNHVVLIGFGRVGGVVAEELRRQNTPMLLIEDAEDRVLAAREAGIEVVVGNAATGEVLRAANIVGARDVVIAIPNAFEAGQATEQCRKLNSTVKIIARAHADEEVDYLRRLGADEVIMGEREIGLGMIDWLRGEERTTMKRDAGPGLRFAEPENAVGAAAGEAEPMVAAVAAVAPEVEPEAVVTAVTPAAEPAPEPSVAADLAVSVAGPAVAAEAPASEVTEAAAEVTEAGTVRVVPASSITLLLPGGEEVSPLGAEPRPAARAEEGMPYAPSGAEPRSFESAVRSEFADLKSEAPKQGDDEDRFPAAPSATAPEPVVVSEPAGADAPIVPPVEPPDMGPPAAGRGQEREKAETES